MPDYNVYLRIDYEWLYIQRIFQIYSQFYSCVEHIFFYQWTEIPWIIICNLKEEILGNCSTHFSFDGYNFAVRFFVSLLLVSHLKDLGFLFIGIQNIFSVVCIYRWCDVQFSLHHLLECNTDRVMKAAKDHLFC